MHDQSDQDRPIETIEEMPAAPEADPGTRDADAPTWSAPTEGHLDLPGGGHAGGDATLTAAAAADTGPGPDAEAAPAAGPAAAPEMVVTGDRIEVNAGGAQRIEGREVTVNQGGAMVIRGDKVRVDQGGALVILGRKIEMNDGGALLVIARRIEGDVNVGLDWRGLLAIFAGIVAILVVRGRR
ncbi:MAG: hypothetical protein U0869_20585 [Chloroflexota bacterium]